LRGETAFLLNSFPKPLTLFAFHGTGVSLNFVTPGLPALAYSSKN